MSNKLMLDVDQARELKAAFRRTRGSDGSEWTNEDIKKSSEGNFFGLVLDVLDGRAEIVPIKNPKEISEPAIERIRIVDEMTIMVNLDAPPRLPFEGAKIEFQTGSGWVKVAKRMDGLYVDDRKVILHLSEQQKGGKAIKGYNLRDELSEKLVLHPNILDALMEHLNLIPEDWKKEKGNIRFIFFWAVIFCYSDGRLCVRYLFWAGDQWNWLYDRLGYDFDGSRPAALLA